MRYIYAVLVVLAVTLTSCLGVKADIVINSDNSGTVTVEYRISSFLESLGKQDGNEGYPPLPVGKTDMERTVARLPGMKLLSHVTRNDGKDKLYIARLQFSDLNTLMKFLDAYGEKAVYEERGPRKITMDLGGGRKFQNGDFEDFLKRICAGYNVAISMSFPSSGELVLLDNEGRPSPQRSGIITSGKKVSFTLPMESVLFAQNGIKAEFTWR